MNKISRIISLSFIVCTSMCLGSTIDAQIYRYFEQTIAFSKESTIPIDERKEVKDFVKKVIRFNSTCFSDGFLGFDFSSDKYLYNSPIKEITYGNKAYCILCVRVSFLQVLALREYNLWLTSVIPRKGADNYSKQLSDLSQLLRGEFIKLKPGNSIINHLDDLLEAAQAKGRRLMTPMDRAYYHVQCDPVEFQSLLAIIPKRVSNLYQNELVGKKSGESLDGESKILLDHLVYHIFKRYRKMTQHKDGKRIQQKLFVDSGFYMIKNRFRELTRELDSGKRVTHELETDLYTEVSEVEESLETVVREEKTDKGNLASEEENMLTSLKLSRFVVLLLCIAFGGGMLLLVSKRKRKN